MIIYIYIYIYIYIHTHTHTHTEEYYSATKIKEILPFSKTGTDTEYNAKWNKSDRERQILYDFISIWNLKNKLKTELIVHRTDGWLPEVWEMGESGQKVQTSSYLINKSWGCKIQHGD